MTRETKVELCLGLGAGVIIVAAFMAFLTYAVMARDDGRFAQSDLKSWFEKLSSGKGLCCSIADGRTVTDPDIDMNGAHYRVRVDGTWLDVPDDAVITEPNRFGQPVVWPYVDALGITRIRCFMPGSGT